MELNITRQTVSINEPGFTQNVEQGLDFSVTIPEYLGAVQRILKYYITPRISSKTINGQVLKIDGTACFNVIFLDDDNEISGFEYSVPFCKNVELNTSIDATNITVSAKCGYANIKPVSSSKIDVHSVIELGICIYYKKTTEVICDVDSSDVFLLRETTDAAMPISTAEKNMIIEEELMLDSEQPSIGCILRCKPDVCVQSTKIVNDKVIAKGELSVEIFYCSENKKERNRYCAAIPFSQIIDIDGINENCECDVCAEIAAFEIKPRNAYDGEARSFILTAKLMLCAKATCNDKICVIRDAYSSKFDTTATDCDVTIESIYNKFSELFVCKKTLEFSDGDIEKIIDHWCLTSVAGYKVEQNFVIISGTVNICILAENVSGTVNYFERPIDFEYRFDAGKLPQNIRLEPSVAVANSSFAPAGQNALEIKIELSLTASIYKVKQMKLITDLTIKEDKKCSSADDCSIIIYYATKGESVWNIAKKFGASPDEIMAVNSVGEQIFDNTQLLISC